MRYTKLLPAVPAALAVVVLLTACAVAPNATPSPLGGTWHVSELNGLAVDHADAAVIQFTVGGEIQGSSGCHDFRGPVQIGDRTLRVGALTSGPPVVPCAKSTQDAEAAFLAALRLVSSFRAGRPGDQLVLEGLGGTIVLGSGT